MQLVPPNRFSLRVFLWSFVLWRWTPSKWKGRKGKGVFLGGLWLGRWGVAGGRTEVSCDPKPRQLQPQALERVAVQESVLWQSRDAPPLATSGCEH